MSVLGMTVVEVDALIGLARLSAAMEHAPILTSPSCHSSWAQPQPPPAPQAVVVAPPQLAKPKKGKGSMRWKEPIGLTEQTKFRSQKVMRATGRIVTSVPFSSTSQKPQVVAPQIPVLQIQVPQTAQWWSPPPVAPTPVPEPLKLAAPLPQKASPKRAREPNVQWVPSPTSKQLCGDGRFRNKNKSPAREGNVSPSVVHEKELSATDHAGMHPVIGLRLPSLLLETDAPAQPAKRVFWTNSSLHHKLAGLWAGGDEAATTPPALTTATSSSASENDDGETPNP